MERHKKKKNCWVPQRKGNTTDNKACNFDTSFVQRRQTNLLVRLLSIFLFCLGVCVCIVRAAATQSAQPTSRPSSMKHPTRLACRKSNSSCLSWFLLFGSLSIDLIQGQQHTYPHIHRQTERSSLGWKIDLWNFSIEKAVAQLLSSPPKFNKYVQQVFLSRAVTNASKEQTFGWIFISHAATHHTLRKRRLFQCWDFLFPALGSFFLFFRGSLYVTGQTRVWV